MKGVRSFFSEKELDFMESEIGLVLSNDYDYSDDELIEIHMKITDELPMEFDTKGNPLESGILFERIVDKFYDYLGI